MSTVESFPPDAHKPTFCPLIILKLNIAYFHK